jgi:hypothetical protein
MRLFGRGVLLLFVAISLVAAGVPPPLDEDRSVPGFCSPDCPLQHVGHSVAVAPAPGQQAGRVEPAREAPTRHPAQICVTSDEAPAAPRAPPTA